MHNILRASLWWPILHKDAKEHCKRCDVYQRTWKPYRRDEIPLVPQLTLQACDKWEIDLWDQLTHQESTLVPPDDEPYLEVQNVETKEMIMKISSFFQSTLVPYILLQLHIT